MKLFGFWKLLVPPAVVPLGLSLFVAMAGPGGVVDVGSTAGSEDGGGEDGCFLTVLKDAGKSYLVLDEHATDPDMPEGGVAGNQNALDRICFGAVDGSDVDATSVPGKNEDGCFLTVLKDAGQSYLVLNEHVSDPGKPEGGVAGNQNALDRICFGTVDESNADTTSVPGKSEDAPGKSKDVPAPSTGQTTTAPGKSENASGDPTAGGNASGQGQTQADESGNGPAGAPVHDKDPKEKKP